MNYTVPEYCGKIIVNVPCNRKGHFEITGENAKKIIPLMKGETIFSTNDGNCTISLIPNKEQNNVQGAIDIKNGDCHKLVAEYLKSAPLCIHFWNTIVEFTLTCPYAPEIGKDNSENAHRTWLCIDLGNTRTCALLDLPDDEIAFYDVVFSSHDPKTAKNSNTQGIIESLCAAIDCQDNEGRYSFVTFGKEALMHKRQNKAADNKRTVFSSPKRHFWDDTRDKQIQKLKGREFTSFDREKLNIFEKKLLGDTSYCSPKHIFQCSIIELMEQAANTLKKLKNDPKQFNCISSFGEKRNDDEIQKINQELDNLDGITDLVFTYPAAWTVHERKTYENVISEACRLYNSKSVAGCKEFRSIMSCDEATAVLMFYLKKMLDERKEQTGIYQGENPMASWIYENGKINIDEDKLMRCRIGVIDIGGGTSDLTIAEMRSEKVDDQLRVKVSSLCSNGTNEAGDILLLNIIRKMLMEMVAISFFASDTQDDFTKGKDIVKKNKFIESFTTFLDDESMKTYARSFWFNLAIEAVMTMEEANANGGRIKPIKRSLDDSDDDIKNGYNEIKEKIKETTFGSEYIQDSSSDIEIKFPGNWQELYKNAIAETFSATAALLSSTLLVYDCDMLLFSGKTMEIKSVQEFFKQYLTIQCLPLDNPKKATAIGAEYYVRKDDQTMGLGIELVGYNANTDENFYWYVPVDSRFIKHKKKTFKQNEEINFPLAKPEITISRQKFNFTQSKAEAMSFRTASYILKFDVPEDFKTSDSYNISLQYEGYELKIKSIKDKHGNECKDKWALRLCMLNAYGKSWLDSGKIVP